MQFNQLMDRFEPELRIVREKHFYCSIVQNVALVSRV